MKLRIVPIVCVFLLCLPLLAFGADKPGDLNQVMSRLGTIMEELLPLVVSRRSLDPAEQQTIFQSVKEMELLFRKAESHLRQKSTTYEISYEYMLAHLATIREAFSHLELNFVRSQLYELGAICTSCHTQDTRTRTLFQGAKRERFSDDHSYAEFNYITRNYPLALRYYDAFLRSSSRKTELEIIQPLQRVITVFVQVRNNPDLAVQSLRAYLPLAQHTSATREQLLGWIKGAQLLAPIAREAGELSEFTQLERFVQRVLAEPLNSLEAAYADPVQEVERVWLRGVLYRYLSRHATESEVPKILYWLALSNRAIDYNFYFSLSDLYLKECMTHFPRHAIARQCFQEYESYVRNLYAGSGGDFMPEEVRQELQRFRRQVNP